MVVHLARSDQMDTTLFSEFMKKSGKPKHVISSCVASFLKFENFLSTSRGDKNVEEATPDDLQEFVKWGMGKNEAVYRDLWGIDAFYVYVKNDFMYT